jgi:hypothetical protein
MTFSCAYSSNTLGSMKIWEFLQYLSDVNPSRLTVLYEVGINYLRHFLTKHDVIRLGEIFRSKSKCSQCIAAPQE